MGKYRRQPDVLNLATRSDFPKAPAIAVQADSESVLGGAHARVFIAAFGSGRKMKYYMTDLQGDPNKPAKIYFKEATSWAKPNLAKTWNISQLRAETAVAVAKQFARLTSAWTGYGIGFVAMFPAQERIEDNQEHIPVKYGKKGTLLGKLHKSQSKYMTCASYAQRIMLAAGVPAPKYLFLQTSSNLVDYNKNHVSALVSLLRNKRKK